METSLAIVTSENCWIRQKPGSGCNAAQNDSGIEDEIFSGWAVRTLEEPDEFGWVKIETHYGYVGHVHQSQLRRISLDQMKEHQNKKRYFRIDIGEADLLSEPKVQGLPLELLMRSAIVELLERECRKGWCLVRTAAGREGYIHTRYLQERQDDDGYLIACASADQASTGHASADRASADQASTSHTSAVDASADQVATEDHIKSQYFLERLEKQKPNPDVLRTRVMETAKKYLGTQYRWGGKSSQGIDCSGLMFMSYLENGILIYRDAKILPEYPVKKIDFEQIQPGDFLFFPGHVGMYLGNRQFIHSTAYDETACVTINSLNPKDSNYRADLAEKMEGCGSVFP